MLLNFFLTNSDAFSKGCRDGFRIQRKTQPAGYAPEKDELPEAKMHCFGHPSSIVAVSTLLLLSSLHLIVQGQDVSCVSSAGHVLLRFLEKKEQATILFGFVTASVVSLAVARNADAFFSPSFGPQSVRHVGLCTGNASRAVASMPVQGISTCTGWIWG